MYIKIYLPSLVDLDIIHMHTLENGFYTRARHLRNESQMAASGK